ncbi:hypothetical protein OAR23_01285 [bacterium]|nr:hypothetical protein [bacterium]
MGSINLDNTGSGGAITLSSDGTSLLLGGTAIGGGGADLYAANPVSATDPTAAGNNGIAIGSNASNTTTHGSANGLAIGTDAVADYYATSLGAGTDATGNSSLAVGYNAQATGTKSTAIMRSYASGTTALAAVIDNNTSSYGATGTNSIAIGDRAKATSSNTLAAGSLTTSSGGDGSTSLGYISSATGLASFTAGTFCTASGKWSQAIGYDATTQSISGKLAKANGDFSAAGDAQYGVLVLRQTTSDATAKTLISELTPFVTTGNATNQVILPNNSAYSFSGTIVARQQAADGTACAAWKVEGLIRREGSAGTTVLVNSATTVLDNTPSWGMALSADTTNGGLSITVTGAASTDIRWVATIHTSEVTYA